MADARQEAQCGIVQILIVLALPVVVFTGYAVGRHFGIWQAVLGALLGLVLTIPLVGSLLMVVALFGALFERLRR